MSAAGPEPVVPRLEHLLRLEATLGQPLEIGETTPGRRRRTIPITGGRFAGERLRGVVLPGGADWQELLPDGTALIDTRYALRTDEGDLVDVRTRGSRTGPPEVLEALLRGEEPPPRAYAFRLAVEFASAAPGLGWLNGLAIVGSAVRRPAGVVYDAYVVA